MSEQLVKNIRKENYVLQIYMASGNNDNVPKITIKLIEFIQEVYRSLEPSHFAGQLAIYTTFDDSIPFDQGAAVKLYDKNILINNTSDVITIQLFQNEELPILWQNIDSTALLTSNNAVTYVYQNKIEFFTVNTNKIDIVNRYGSASIYALQYHLLNEALLKYKEEKMRYASCAIFQDCIYDKATRIYLLAQPEDVMQISLSEFLVSSLRGVDVVREYNLGASKPVDVRVYWKEANRAALIELKWLGQSISPDGTLATAYANARGNDGLDQIKEYMDLENQDTPTCITKGYLVIIDARRRGTTVTPLLTTINTANGMHYSNKDIEFADAKKYYESMVKFERPIRMFVNPVCTL